MSVVQEVREINAEKELPHVLARIKAWAKHQLIRRGIERLAVDVDGTEDERNAAWKALQDGWHYGDECRLEDGHDLLSTAIEQPPEIVEGVLLRITVYPSPGQHSPGLVEAAPEGEPKEPESRGQSK